MKNIHRLLTIFLFTGIITFGSTFDSLSQQSCSGCHPSMAEESFKLPDSPPADLLLGLTTPCFDYGGLLEEWYYVEELFVTTEHHLVELEEARYHVEPFYEQLLASREYLREVVKEPVISLVDFKQKTGKLRFDVGKIYRDVKTKRIEQRSRNVLGAIILGTIFILFLIVTGWRVISGSGVVHPTKTKLGYDELKQLEAKEKEAAE